MEKLPPTEEITKLMFNLDQDAYYGDAILTIVLRTYFTAKDKKAYEITKSNDFLDRVARYFNIEPSEHDISKKRYANMVEAKIFQIYLTDGLTGATSFIKDTVIKYFNEHVDHKIKASPYHNIYYSVKYCYEITNKMKTPLY